MEYEIIQRINHPNYKSPSVYNDIALYKLASKVDFNEYIRPICLQIEHQFPKTYAIATGWGRTEWGELTYLIGTADKHRNCNEKHCWNTVFCYLVFTNKNKKLHFLYTVC